MRWRVRLTSCALLLAPSPSIAQSPPVSTPAPSSDIVVRGQRPDDPARTRTAVAAIGQPAEQGGLDAQYARWHVPICVLLEGMPRDGAHFVADGIGAVARRIGAAADGPGCRPNVYVIVTTDPAKFVTRARVRRPGLFAGVSAAEIDRLEKSVAPIRWASATEVTSSQGDPIQIAEFGTPPRKVRVLPQWRASHLYAATRTALARTIAVVDAGQLSGVSYDALSSYLAFVTLAQLRPGAGAPTVKTILSLFSGSADRPSDLTSFDLAYLTALYEVDPALPATTQRLAISGKVSRALASAER